MNYIRAVRESRGLTQEQVAAEIGVSRKQVQRWERGASRPTIDRRAKLLRVLDCLEVDIFPDARPRIEATRLRVAKVTRLDGTSFEVISDLESRDEGSIWFAGESPPPEDALMGMVDALVDELQADLYGHGLRGGPKR